ncbi:MAG: phospholipid/cholesterol/gamma-HCH transport system substrate-binding protein [Actinomycetota bacterium]|nr:phospholipid/cholesterol/gamma-HCH transport system substrate-binding protein [Actinomycetota bacterium]
MRVRRPVVVALVGALAAVPLASCSGGSKSGTHITAYFSRAVSLYPSSSVRVLGLPAGTVDKVTVQGRRVKVDMTVKESVPVPADVQATIVPLSLIGERYIQLSPAWTLGQPKARDGLVIPLSRTDIPVEPDEALAALKKFIDTIDPKTTGRLVKNLADDLNGNGASLNKTLEGVAGLATTFAEKDQQLVEIIDHFDSFTATLRTKESQLGRVMDGFARTTSLLAEERRQIEALVGGLADLSTTGLDLVSEHGVRLDHDITVLTRVLRSVQANIDNVVTLLDSAPLLVAGPDLNGKDEGLLAAYDPEFNHIDLRTAISPVLANLFTAIGLPALAICLPIDVSCTAAAAGQAATTGGKATAQGAPAAAPAPTTTTPIDSIVGLLGSSTTGPATTAVPRPTARSSTRSNGNVLTRLSRLLVGGLT